MNSSNQPLVSIVVPTRNSAKTLPLCLASIRRQTYRNIEVIVVDSYSTDNTPEIAKRFGAKVIQTRGRLLWARYVGHLHAQGEIELLIDSDQILHPRTVEKIVKAFTERGCDTAILEEHSWKPKTFTQWLYHLDRLHIHKIRDYHPIHGVLLARAYRRDVLDKAFNEIKKRLPPKTMFLLIAQDHAIIYYEAYKHTNKLCYIPNAVYHIEPKKIVEVIKKSINYAKNEFNIVSYYNEISGKYLPRKISLDVYFVPSMLLWLTKAIAYLLTKMCIETTHLRGY